MIYAEADYIGRLTGDRPKPSFKWQDGPSVAEIFAFSGQVADAMLDAIRRISPTQSFMRRKMAILSITMPGTSLSRLSTTALSTVRTLQPSSAAWVSPHLKSMDGAI